MASSFSISVCCFIIIAASLVATAAFAVTDGGTKTVGGAKTDGGTKKVEPGLTLFQGAFTDWECSELLKLIMKANEANGSCCNSPAASPPADGKARSTRFGSPPKAGRLNFTSDITRNGIKWNGHMGVEHIHMVATITVDIKKPYTYATLAFIALTFHMLLLQPHRFGNYVWNMINFLLKIERGNGGTGTNGGNGANVGNVAARSGGVGNVAARSGGVSAWIPMGYAWRKGNGGNGGNGNVGIDATSP